MKSFLLSVLLNIQIIPLIFAQTPQLTLSLNKNSSVTGQYQPNAQKAFMIASAVFNSAEFQDSVKNLNFPYRNYCRNCKPIRIYLGSKTISGQTVLDSLFKRPAVTMSLELDSGTCDGSLGQTCPLGVNPKHLTTSYYNALACDMPELNFPYRLAVNLCHEYMHFVGFCHLDPIDKAPDKDHPAPIAYRRDIAYRVGWIAYYILIRWQKEGRFN
jgi:hypothetical protein